MRQSNKLDTIKTIILHLLLWVLLGGLWHPVLMALCSFGDVFAPSANYCLDWTKWMPGAMPLGWLAGVTTSMWTSRKTMGYYDEVHFTLGGVSVLLGSIIGAIVGILPGLLIWLIVALVPGMTVPSALGWLPDLPPLGALLGIVLALVSLTVFGVSMVRDDRRRRTITSRRSRSQWRPDRLPGPIRFVVIYADSLLRFFLMVCLLIALFLVNTLHDLKDRKWRKRL
jgi:hypothetical protein